MSRIALGLEYDGALFCGWQRQAAVPTVQACLEQALSKIAAAPITTTSAGRTDKGVHATDQVVHFDAPTSRRQDAWIRGTNRYLPPSIRVQWAVPVADSFDARRSAQTRRYRYYIYNHRTAPGLFRDQITWHHRALDPTRMQQAAQAWLGEHDFSSFRAADCQSVSPVRYVQHISVQQQGPLIVLEIVANAFLHHMVRNMVGVLLPIGEARAPVTWAKDVLQARDRCKAGITALPNGLYLAAVSYPQAYALPARVNQPWFLSP